MKTKLARVMLLALLSAGSAFTQQSQQIPTDVQQVALQEAASAQGTQANEQASQPDNRNFSSSKKHKTTAKKEKKKKHKKQDRDLVSPAFGSIPTLRV